MSDEDTTSRVLRNWMADVEAILDGREPDARDTDPTDAGVRLAVALRWVVGIHGCHVSWAQPATQLAILTVPVSAVLCLVDHGLTAEPMAAAPGYVSFLLTEEECNAIAVAIEGGADDDRTS